MSKQYRVLVVCLGNICRSPLAESLLREELAAAGLGDRVVVDSAGTGDWNVGKPPDPRMVAAAGETGLEVSGTARQIAAEDLRNSDAILVMDRQNLADVLALASDDQSRQKVHLFREFAGDSGEVPDPYYGGDETFTEVVALVRSSAQGVVDAISRSLAAA